MLPEDWDKKLVDMNVTNLKDEDLKWADYVFLSAMVVQKKSADEVIARCKKYGTKVVAGGPLFTMEEERSPDVAHYVLGEAEVTLLRFLADIKQGCAEHVYHSDARPPLASTPIPLWSLIDMKHYATMNIQYSRGCPYDCEFCDIVFLNGRVPRTKSKEQILSELDSLYERGWHGSVFIVDDNFIGNKQKLKSEILPAMAAWSEARGYPFIFYTEASINLADDDELMQAMIKAGFNRVFIGIETPNEESLNECNKQQNRGRDLAESVRIIQNHGFEVQGGFIVGFDNDPASIFRSQINFIQKTGIVTAMVGLLNAPRGTRLYHRLKKENRLLADMSGDNTDCSLNFIPKMKTDTLIDGYKQILSTIYSPAQYYHRITTFLKEYKPPNIRVMNAFRFYHIAACFRIIWILGIIDKGRKHFWHLLITTFFRNPRLIPISVNLAVFGHHFRKIAEKIASSSFRVNTAVDAMVDAR